VSVRAANTLVLVVGVVSAIGLLFIAGCFTAKISASPTAAILRHDNTSWRRVTCKPYKGDGWDYTCRVVPKGAEPFSFDVSVNGNGITDQTAP
jgi:hypothetical protein